MDNFNIKFSIIFLFSLLNLFAFSTSCLCKEQKIIYRNPSLYNPNPISGRLYLQPIGTHEDQSLIGFHAEIGVGSSVDYNIYFVEDPNFADDRLTVNSNILTLKFLNGFCLFSHRMEVGGIMRSHQDERETYMSNFIKKYHQKMNFGNIPTDGRYYGAIGENSTEIIAEDSGDIFLTTFQMYAKIQILRDRGVGSSVPNLSLKTSVRLPMSNYAFDTKGISLSTGISKEVYPKFFLAFAAGFIFQDTSEDDFDATNIKVNKWAYDGFFGCVWDIGKKGAWYVSPGLRISSERVYYTENPESADGSFCTHWGISYRKPLKNGNIMEFFFNFNEDLPGLGYGLEPDFRAQSGVTIKFENGN